MKNIKIEWNKDSKNLSEIYQSTGMCFSFLSPPKDGFKEVHQPVLCRDFLHDAVRAYVTGEKVVIYHFSYSRENNPPIDMRRTRIIVSTKDLRSEVKESSKTEISDFNKTMEYSKSLLNYFEVLANIPKSSVKYINDGNRHVWVFTGPSAWMKSPYLLSMYTFLIRLGCKHIKFNSKEELLDKIQAIIKEEAHRNDNDHKYLKTCTMDKLHTIMKNYTKMLTGRYDRDYFEKINISNFHNKSGIVSLCSANTPNKMRNTLITSLFKSESEDV